MLYSKYIKRGFDLIISISAIVMFFPLFLVVAVLLLIGNKSTSVFFTQKRPGYKGKIFKVIKFKSMTDERDKNGELLPNEKRITAIGKFIRKTSIDELPQLINVLKGDMSLIGPRPLLVEYLPLYTKEQARRHSVRPGITGWAQVNGRNAISWTEKFEYDVWYVDNISLSLDVRILLLTIKKVFGQDGINESSDQIGIKKFNGNN